MRYSLVNKVWVTEGEIRHRGGISIVWREEAGWQVEGATIFGSNVVSFTITEGQKIWYVVGSYVPTNNQPVVHWEEGVEALIFGNLDSHLAQPRDQWKEDLATAISSHGIAYQSMNFITRQIYRGEGDWSCSMWRYGRTISGRGD